MQTIYTRLSRRYVEPSAYVWEARASGLVNAKGTRDVTNSQEGNHCSYRCPCDIAECMAGNVLQSDAA